MPSWAYIGNKELVLPKHTELMRTILQQNEKDRAKIPQIPLWVSFIVPRPRSSPFLSASWVSWLSSDWRRGGFQVTQGSLVWSRQQHCWSSSVHLADQLAGSSSN